VRRAADFLCPYSSRPADEWHHLTGRDAGRTYLDAGSVVPIARRPHVLVHQSWRVLGIDDGSECSPHLLRLQRSGSLFCLLGEQHRDRAVELPGFTVHQHGLMLLRIARDLGALGWTS
jgi:hypothetical protein